MYDVIIVGAGPAGIACALRCKELNLTPLVLEQGVIANTLSDYHDGKKMFGVVGFFQRPADELIDFYKKDLLRAEVEVHEEEKVVGVKKKEKDGFFEVSTKKGTYKSQAVVIAIGVQGLPQTLGVAGEDRKHVHYKLDDAQKYKGKNVLVVGGGDSAVEAAIALSNAGAKTVLSYRRHEFFRVKELNVKCLNESCAEVRFTTNVVEIKDKKALLRSPTDLIEEVKADVVFIFVGTLENRDFFKGIGLDVDNDGAVVYDEETLETSVKGIFVAGDIIKEKQKLIMPAMYHGFIAANSVMNYKMKNK